MASNALSGVYNALFRRNTVMLSTVFLSAFAIEIVWDNSYNKIWDSINRGRQWKDIKQKYLEPADDDDDE